MADTIRERIIKAYLARLATWTTANGYQQPCGLNVERAKSYLEESQLPACVLWPGQEESEKLYGKQICIMALKVEALAVPGAVDPSVVQEQLLGEAIKIMMAPEGGPADLGLVEDIAYARGGPAGGSEPEENTTAILAEFQVKYKTRIGDPYSQ